MDFKYSSEIVVSAMTACCDQGGDSSERNLGASQFLQAYQESTYVWDISEQMLGKMDEKEDVLVLAVVTLRYKIRNHLSELSALQHTSLFKHLVSYIKCATKKDMQKLVRYLSVSMADMLLRLHWQKMIEICANQLFKKASPGLFQVLEVMPAEASLLNENEHLKAHTDELLNFLNCLQYRKEVNGTLLHRALFLICASWTRTHFLTIEKLTEHSVVANALQIMHDPKLFNGEIAQEASDCLVAVLEHVAHMREHQTTPINWNLEDKIYKSCISIKLPTLPSETNQMNATAVLYIQVAETYASLDAVNTPSGLLERGPFCYELLLQVATHCNLDIILSSMPLWHNLFGHIPFKFEKELCEIYCSIVVRAVNIFFKKCRLPEKRLKRGSHDFDTMTELRNHVTDLLHNVSELEGILNLKTYSRKLIQTAFGFNTPWDDIELSIFFLTPVIPKLFKEDTQLVVELVRILPSRAFDHATCAAIRQQIINLNTECHKFYDSLLERHQFVQQMVNYGSELGTSLDDLDTLEVITRSCNTLKKCRKDDLIAFENCFYYLEDKLSKIPRETHALLQDQP